MAAYVSSVGPANTVLPGQAYLNNLANMSLDGSRVAEYNAWKSANPGGVNWNSPELQQLLTAAQSDPTAKSNLSAWAYSNPYFGGDQALKNLGIDISKRVSSTPSAGVLGLLGTTASQWNAADAATSANAANHRYNTAATSPAPTGFGGVGSVSGSADPVPSLSANTASPNASQGSLTQGVNVNQYTPNPYMSQWQDTITNKLTDNYNRNVAPGIRSGAMAAGGYGGSRQGVVEANAMKDLNGSISDALTGAQFQDYTNQMNRNLQQYGLNQNFYTANRGLDLNQTQLGANLYNLGNQGYLSQGSGLYNLGTSQQQAPWQVINNGNAALGQWSGYGTTTSANTGGGTQGLLGGALGGAQLANLFTRNSSANSGTLMGDLPNLGMFSRT